MVETRKSASLDFYLFRVPKLSWMKTTDKFLSFVQYFNKYAPHCIAVLQEIVYNPVFTP